jgi:hypothetical protein
LARGEFARQAIAAVGMLFALWLALSSSVFGYESWYLALAAGPWVAVALYAALSFSARQFATREAPTVGSWVHALARVRREVAVWEARVVTHPVEVTAHIEKHLGERGAIVRTGRRLLWFEVGDPFTEKNEWLHLTGGALAHLAGERGASGAAQRERIEARGTLGTPETRGASRSERASSFARLEAEFVRLFPQGFVVHVGRRPPAAFASLAPVERQAIWRDALRAQRGSRSRSGWFVTSYAPDGATEAFFATRRPVTAEEGARWHAIVAPHGYRILLSAPDMHRPRRDEREHEPKYETEDETEDADITAD